MQINTPDDLFKIYAFSDEAKLEIKQLFNANKVFVLQINALCLSIKDEPYKAEAAHKYLFSKIIQYMRDL